MSFIINLDHTTTETWQKERESKWQHVCLHSFSSNTPEEELKPYKEYFFYGDVDAVLSSETIIDFRTILFWTPANNLNDIKRLFSHYWEWFFNFEDNEQIYKGGGYYSYETPEEYLNSILLDLASWTSLQPPMVVGELFLWIFGDSYEEDRTFPTPLGGDNWTPAVKVDLHLLAVYLLRGVRRYLFSYKKESDDLKYGALIDYFLSVFKFIEPRVYALSRMNDDEVRVELDHTDQNMMRWFLANLEGVPTKREIKKNNGEIPHNDPEKEAILRDGLEQLTLHNEYQQLVEFIHNQGKNCLTYFEEDG